MINFFRKTRKNLANDNKLLKYTRYAIGEILLVVIGILIALSINNWNQLRLEKFEERNILINLKSEFEGNLEEIRSTNETRNSVLKSTNRVFEFVDNTDYSNPKSLDSLIRICFINPSFDPQQGSLNSLIYSGRLEMLSNVTLRDLLISWPGLVTDLKEEESLLRTQAFSLNIENFEELASVRNVISSQTGIISGSSDRTLELRATFKLIGQRIKRSARASNYEKLFKSHSFESRLSNRFRTIKRSLVEGMIIHKRSEEILNIIESELE